MNTKQFLESLQISRLNDYAWLNRRGAANTRMSPVARKKRNARNRMARNSRRVNKAC